MKHLVLCASLLCLSAGAAAASPFDPPLRVEHTHTQRWVAPPEEVLPLLTVERENEWAEDFEPHVLFSGSPPGGEGSVFVTTYHGERTVWTTSRYDPDALRVEYFRVHGDHYTVQLYIQLRADGSGGTTAEIRYAYTGLSEAGRQKLATFTKEYYREFMTEWEAALNHFLRTGKRLESPKHH